METQKDICREFELRAPKGAIKCELDGEKSLRVEFANVWNFWIDKRGVSFEIGAYGSVLIQKNAIVLTTMVGDPLHLIFTEFELTVDNDSVRLYLW